MSAEYRKRIKHYHEAGDLHELTFSTYRRLPLLTNDTWRAWLARSIDAAMVEHAFQLAAFVFMPEHVHLLVYPTAKPNVDQLLARIKQPFSAQIRRALMQSASPLHDKLRIRERPGKTVFRFWQEGPGYDRNLNQVSTVLASIRYLHENPVKGRLCQKATDWKWSSACYYSSPQATSDSDLPILTMLPANYIDELAGRNHAAKSES